MDFCNPARDGETESGTAAIVFAAGAGFIRAHKALKNARLHVFGNSWTAIGDLQCVRAVALGTPHGDAAAARGIFYGVVQQIEDHPAHQRFVRKEGKLFLRRGLERDLFCASQRSGGMYTVRDQFIQIKMPGRQRILPGVRSRQREQILDDAG